MAALELWMLSKKTGARPSELYQLPTETMQERTAALAFDVTVMRAAKKAKRIAVDSALAGLPKDADATAAMLQLMLHLG